MGFRCWLSLAWNVEELEKSLHMIYYFLIVLLLLFFHVSHSLRAFYGDYFNCTECLGLWNPGILWWLDPFVLPSLPWAF